MNEFTNSPSNYQVKQLSSGKPSNKVAEVIITSCFLVLGMPNITQTTHAFNTVRYEVSKETDFFDTSQNLEYDIHEIKSQQNKDSDSYKANGVSYNMNEQNDLTQRDLESLIRLIDEKENKLQSNIENSNLRLEKKLIEKIEALPTKKDVTDAVTKGIENAKDVKKKRNFSIWTTIFIPLVAAFIGAALPKLIELFF